ncbi:MAG: multicopper oxidase family protein [bacterium]|nr:multicopper oxidase family protein [bacterium]
MAGAGVATGARRWIAAALVLGTTGLATAAPRPILTNPPQLASVNGVLEATLQVGMQTFTVANKLVTAPVYNGSYIPPTLRVRPGDTIALHFVNAIDQPTNLHYHGMNVSPLAPGDDVFLHIAPLQTYDYRIDIPATHPSGAFYYHPHQYGLTESQIMGGMSGLLIVDGLLAPFPQLAGITDREIVLKDIQIKDGRLPDDIDPSAPTNRTVNGMLKPRIEIAPGETQLWRIANIGTDIYYKLRLDGHQFHVAARDGNRQNQITSTKELLMPPASRFEVLIQAKKKGRYDFRALKFNTGPVGDRYPGTVLATMVVKGRKQTQIALPTPDQFPPVPDLRSVPNRKPRTIVFSESSDGNTFYIGGKEFDPTVVDTTVNLGDVEEWTIKNCSQELHVFHIHQLDFQVTAVNGEPTPFTGYQDTVNMPFATGEGKVDEDCENGTPGIVTAIVPFIEPTNVGKFVYHCHIGEHEDNGMMAVIEVKDPGGE